MSHDFLPFTHISTEKGEKLDDDSFFVWRLCSSTRRCRSSYLLRKDLKTVGPFEHHLDVVHSGRMKRAQSKGASGIGPGSCPEPGATENKSSRICPVPPTTGKPGDKGKTGNLTQLLHDWRSGDDSALSKLIPLIDTELRTIARRYLRQARQSPNLDRTTELVNETYACLLRQQPIDWENRRHFFAIAARLMRQILVDHARKFSAAKRGGGVAPVPYDDAVAPQAVAQESIDVLSVHEALNRLSALDSRQARVVELRFFGGLTITETAEVLAVSPDTVKRDWRYARLWLRREITESEQHAG